MSTTIYSANYCPSSIFPFHDSDGYYHLIYMIVNKINNKIYIGKHTTKNPYDDYMGSGKLILTAIKKYGKDNFDKIILFCLSTENEAYLKESEIVTAEFVKREDTYNLTVGGEGFSTGENHPRHLKGKHFTEDVRQKISDALKGIQFSDEWKEKLSNAKKGENNPKARAILKLDSEGNIVSEYAYLTVCTVAENIPLSTLWRRVKSGKSYKGYYYKYKEEQIN